jgi:hypothetical protein
VIALVTGAFFAGYTLFYAAVFDGGRYVTRPWDALRP